jgi:misacylated tRNA(Ala) deacylase
MNSTVKLYESEPALRRFEATIVQANGPLLMLDRTGFYPTGGGQPCDLGVLKLRGRSHAIVDVHKRPGGLIEHVLAQPLDEVDLEGAAVEGEIDDSRRSMHARLHTGLHVLTAAVLRRFEGTLVTGAQIKSDGTARMDFDLAGVPKQELAVLEDDMRAMLAEGRVVRARAMPRDEAAAIANLFRSRDVEPPHTPDEAVRVIEIEGLDLQACGGTHTSTTTECGDVYFCKLFSKGRSNRRIVVGLRDLP